jgi:DNA replication licensing factor MCM2
MIRMAESFARMHLRDSVLQSDIDRAISVMVTSFVSTQKIGAQRALEKYLKKYMTFGEDAWELLNHVLCDMMNDEYKYFYYKGTGVPGGVLSVDMDVFEAKAGEFGVDDVSGFYGSGVFGESFYLDNEGGKICKSLAVGEDGDEMKRSSFVI